MAKPKFKVVYAKGTAMATRPNGAGVMVHIGEHWPANDPVVRRHPDLFTDDPKVGLRVSAPLVEDDERPVEQATAAPGEKRQTRRPRKPATIDETDVASTDSEQ